MKIGLCLKCKEYELTNVLKADYFELPFAEVATLDDNEYEKLITSNHEYIAMTQLLQKNMNVVNGEFLFEEYQNFFEKGFKRAQELKVKKIVFGNANSRNIDDVDNKFQCESYLIEFCKMISKIASRFDIKICLEPLNRIQTNYINSVADAAEIIRKVNADNFLLAFDYFHAMVEKENYESVLKENKEILAHCHTANILRRGLPTVSEQLKFLDFLQFIGYKDTLSIEMDRIVNSIEEINSCIYDLRNQTKEMNI